MCQPISGRDKLVIVKKQSFELLFYDVFHLILASDGSGHLDGLGDSRLNQKEYQRSSGLIKARASFLSLASALLPQTGIA